MTEVAVQRCYTADAYLRIENDSSERHEFREGQILDMAGGTPEHSLIAMNVGREVGNALKGKPCRVYGPDLRVRAERDVRYCYPDATVICGEVQLDPRDGRGKTAVNPRLIVEVLSPSTELFDRGEKFRRYLKLESLQEYVMVAQDQPRVETFLRQSDGGWRFEAWEGGDAVAVLRSLSVDLPLTEIYAGVTFPPRRTEVDETDPS